MKNNNYFGMIGILIYLCVALFDRVVMRIPDNIYILVLLVAIIFVILGIIKDKMKGKKK